MLGFHKIYADKDLHAAGELTAFFGSNLFQWRAARLVRLAVLAGSFRDLRAPLHLRRRMRDPLTELLNRILPKRTRRILDDCADLKTRIANEFSEK